MERVQFQQEQVGLIVLPRESETELMSDMVRCSQSSRTSFRRAFSLKYITRLNARIFVHGLLGRNQTDYEETDGIRDCLG